MFKKGVAIGFGDGEVGGADEDAVTLDHGDFVQVDDVGAVDAEEGEGEGSFEVLHAEWGDHGGGLGGEMYFHVVLHAFDVEDVAEGEAYQFASGADEEVVFVVGRCRGGVLLFDAVERFLGGAQEFGVADGFEQVVDGIDLESFHGVLFEGGSEDNLHAVANQAGESQPVEFRHLDVEEYEVDVLFVQAFQGFDGIGVSGLQVQERGASDVGFDQFQR